MKTDHASAHTNAASWNRKKAKGRCGDASLGDTLEAHCSRATSHCRESIDSRSKPLDDTRGKMKTWMTKLHEVASAQ